MQWFNYNKERHALTWTKEAKEELEEIQFIALPRVGQVILKNEILLEVEASKAVYEIEAPFDLKVLKEGEQEIILYVTPL